MTFWGVLLFATTLLQAVGPTAGGASHRVLAQQAYGGTDEPRQVVVSTAPEFETLWRAHATGPAPAIDFTRHAVVGLFLGTRPTAGYAVEVTGLAREGDGLTVRYRETRPAPDALTAQVLTAPFAIVEVPRVRGGVRFERVP